MSLYNYSLRDKTGRVFAVIQAPCAAVAAERVPVLLDGGLCGVPVPPFVIEQHHGMIRAPWYGDAYFLRAPKLKDT